MKNVFIIGSKGIPAKYGGFEAFLENLTLNQISANIKYHISCRSDNTSVFEHNGARCFNVKVPGIGSAKAVYYDLAALKACIEFIRKNNITKPVIYVLACRIGPFIGKYKKQVKRLGGKLYVNPDGNEWKRGKWNWLIRQYWKLSERFMVKHADLLICDSKNIQKYILDKYKKFEPQTTFIAYGAYTNGSLLEDSNSELMVWYKEKEIKPKAYYLVVGRFVPENNYETMLKEFMNSGTQKDLVLITDISNNKLYEKLRETTGFEKDNRIKFVGTVYNAQMLKKIRENAYGYIHGHEVGGTNPSLLEALGSTDLNLLFDVSFNREVGGDGAFYWSKKKGSLAKLISETDGYDEISTADYGKKAKKRIIDCYSWDFIVSEYEKLFLKED